MPGHLAATLLTATTFALVACGSPGAGFDDPDIGIVQTLITSWTASSIMGTSSPDVPVGRS